MIWIGGNEDTKYQIRRHELGHRALGKSFSMASIIFQRTFVLSIFCSKKKSARAECNSARKNNALKVHTPINLLTPQDTKCISGSLNNVKMNQTKQLPLLGNRKKVCVCNRLLFLSTFLKRPLNIICMDIPGTQQNPYFRNYFRVIISCMLLHSWSISLIFLPKKEFKWNELITNCLEVANW